LRSEQSRRDTSVRILGERADADRRSASSGNPSTSSGDPDDALSDWTNSETWESWGNPCDSDDEDGDDSGRGQGGDPNRTMGMELLGMSMGGVAGMTNFTNKSSKPKLSPKEAAAAAAATAAKRKRFNADIFGSIMSQSAKDDLGDARRAAEDQKKTELMKKAALISEGGFEGKERNRDDDWDADRKEPTVTEAIADFVQTRAAQYFFRFIIIPTLVSRGAELLVIRPYIMSSFASQTVELILPEEIRAEIVEETERFESKQHYEAMMGRAPAVGNIEERVKEHAQHTEEKMRLHQLDVDCNRYMDTVFFSTLLVLAAGDRSSVSRMFKYCKDNFFGIEPAQQAFILLLASDVLVGYHSADGWQTVLKEVGGHYGVEEQEEAIALFVAIVPVGMDVLFKFWVFKYLRMLAPSTQIILDDIGGS